MTKQFQTKKLDKHFRNLFKIFNRWRICFFCNTKNIRRAVCYKQLRGCTHWYVDTFFWNALPLRNILAVFRMGATISLTDFNDTTLFNTWRISFSSDYFKCFCNNSFVPNVGHHCYNRINIIGKHFSFGVGLQKTFYFISLTI